MANAYSFPMHHTEFRAIRKRFKVNQSEMAELIGVMSERTIREYERAEHPIPGPVRILARLLVTHAPDGYTAQALEGVRR